MKVTSPRKLQPEMVPPIQHSGSRYYWLVGLVLRRALLLKNCGRFVSVGNRIASHLIQYAYETRSGSIVATGSFELFTGYA